MAGASLRYGEITVTNPDGTATSGQRFEVPRPRFQPKGITHREVAKGTPGGPERLGIMIDLKETVGATTPLARTAPAALHYALDAVEVVVTGTFTVRGADGRDTTRVVAPKDARFIARGSLESVRATAGTPRTITVEIK